MKIKIYHEDKRHSITLDVPDAECQEMIENDYRERLIRAVDGPAATRRTMQEIMDEEFNKPTFNSNHRETRHKKSLDALDPQGDTLVGEEDVRVSGEIGEYADLYTAIGRLEPRQQKLIYEVYYEEIKQKDIAKMENVSEAAVSRRLKRAVGQLRKLLGAV